MKRVVSLLLAVMLLLLCGCSPDENTFQVEFLPSAYDTQATYPKIAVIHNENELLDHLMQSNQSQPERYDSDFFQNRMIFVLTLSIPSSAEGYELERVSKDGTFLTFHIRKIRTAQAGTDVMSATHMLVEMDKSWDTDPQNIKIEYL